MENEPDDIIRKACEKIKRGGQKFKDHPLLEKVYQGLIPTNKILKTKI